MLGETVRTTRIKKGLTQAKLARMAGVSRRHLAALEKGANVSVLVLKKVASVLDLTEIDLGPLTIRGTKSADAPVNIPLLAETIRDAHADALRAQSLLAEAEGLLGNGKGRRNVVSRFPKVPVHRLEARRRHGAAAIADAPPMARVRVAGEIRQGEPVAELKGQTISLPALLIGKGEVVFRARGDGMRDHGIEDGDLLVVELRKSGRASTGELVIGKAGDDLFVGRWWQKHGRKALMSDGLSEVITGASKRALKVLAAINQIVRPEK